MLTAPRRSIFARSAAMAASGSRAAGTPGAAPSSSASSSSPWSAASSARDRPRHGATRLGVLHLGQHLVERGLYGVDAGRGQVRQMAFRGGAVEVERRHGRAGLVEAAAGVTDELFTPVRVGAAGVGALFGGPDRHAERIERREVGVEPRGVFRDGAGERLPLVGGGLEVGAARDRADLHLGRRLLEAPHGVGERRRALGEAGVRRLAFSDVAVELLERFAAFQEAALGERQPLVGGTLLLVEPGDRPPRLGLTVLDGAPFLLGREPLGADERRLPIEALGVGRPARAARRAPPSPFPAGAARRRAHRRRPQPGRGPPRARRPRRRTRPVRRARAPRARRAP